jgi:DNA-directed RNA polymerase subunit M/transcription elongation factor TFIIS
MNVISFREIGVEALKSVLKIENNINIIEKNLFVNVVNKCFNYNKKPETFSTEEYQLIRDMYNDSMYQIINDIQEGIKLKDILNNIKNKNIFWDHHSFDQMLENIKEQNDFIENPFEIEEGVFQCKAFDTKTEKMCGSKKVFSYAKQDRSCDEGTSVYCECINCGAKWRERG